jgi:chromosome partitioning protein
MTKVLSFVNLKGGVGKTALAVNFAAYCGKKGVKTLLVDVDPQTNATFWCMDIDEWENYAKTNGTVANLLGFRPQTFGESSESDINKIIKKNVFENMDLIPSHLDLFTVDLDLAGATGREFRLKTALSTVLQNYGIVVCDCPPNLTIPTQNALAASTNYVIPISPDYLSGIGVGILLKRVAQFCNDLQGHKLKLSGMVISREGRPAIHREQTVSALRKQFGEQVLHVQIKERVAVSESAANHCSIFDYHDNLASEEFRIMSEEILSRL